jgi:heptose I phosphotransferase
VYLHDELKSHFSAKMPLFDQLMALKGDCYRELEGRTTHRIQLGSQAYFIKQHRGVGWKEIFKNVLQGRLPVLGAKNEWLALRELAHLGIAVPQVWGFGQRGCNPASQHSFVLMEALTNVVSLEDLCRDWLRHPPNVKQKRRLIAAVAEIARKMHTHGINHRDFYLCHFLLDQASWCHGSEDRPLKLYLIDLHRAQIRSLTPRRWIIKDLSGLYFSSMDVGLTRRDYYRFMKLYTGQSLRDLMAVNGYFWEKVKERGEQLYRHHNAPR